MKRRLFLAEAVLAVGVISRAAAAPEVVWTPDKAMMARLAPSTAAGSYQIRPPTGFTRQTQQGPEGTGMQMWISAPRKDGVRSYLMIVTMAPPPNEANKYTLEQVSVKMLAGIERQRKDWKQSAPETGKVNGLTFIRTYWRGTDIKTGFAMRGFSYVGRDGKGFIQISSQDVDPDGNKALALTEASALTLRKP